MGGHNLVRYETKNTTKNMYLYIILTFLSIKLKLVIILLVRCYHVYMLNYNLDKC